MPFTGLEDVNITGVESILSFPLTGDYYFWGKFLLALWVILGAGFFFEERLRLGKANILSSLAFASLAVMVLGVIGSSISIITSDILITILVLGSIFIFIWYVKSEN